VNNFSRCAKAKNYFIFEIMRARGDGLKNIMVRRKIVINDEQNNEAERTTHAADETIILQFAQLHPWEAPAGLQHTRARGWLPICVRTPRA
jgi:hypothetical protein